MARAFRDPIRRLGVLWLDLIRALLVTPFGTARLAVRIAFIWAIETVGLLVIASFLDGIVLADAAAAFLTIVITHVLSATVRPVLVYLVLPLVVLTAGLLAIPINALMLLAGAWLAPGAEVDGIGWAILVWVLLAAINATAAWLLDLGEEGSYYRTVATLLATRGRRPRVSDRPGLIILQIDGLGRVVLERALRSGHVPTMARWLRETHELTPWEVALPSQTSASQAGILMGDNDDIPAFRWYEKEAGRLLVSNRPADATTIERRHSSGRGLLSLNGSSLGNLVSGDARRTVLTASTITDLRPGVGRRSRDFLLFLLNPYSSTRVVFRMALEIAVELRQARLQRRRGVEPRMHRGGAFPILRAVACVLLRDITTMLLIEDMHRGIAVIYADYVGYDEVAHHAGPERPESLDALSEIDRQLAALEVAARTAPRPYRFIVLSDHGQSHGATFRQRDGRTLEEVIRGSMAPGTDMRTSTGPAESWGRLNGFLTEALADGGPFAGLVRRLLPRADDATGPTTEIALGPDVAQTVRAGGPAPAGGDRPDLVVCASGNLALVYFADRSGRRTFEEIEAEHPGLIDGLLGHPWVGFVMVRSTRDGAMALGQHGRRRLADDAVEGSDPLADFGDFAAAHLRRLDGFTNVSDLVVNSAVDPASGEVAAFEELIGSHGGLGGLQTGAFLLAPADLPRPASLIVGAPAVFEVLQSWRPMVEDVVPNQGAAVAAESATSSDSLPS